jgi:hypothetical protein
MSELKPCLYCKRIPDVCETGKFAICQTPGCPNQYEWIAVEVWNEGIPDLCPSGKAESERFTVHSRIKRQDNKYPNDTQPDTIVYGKDSEK